MSNVTPIRPDVDRAELPIRLTGGTLRCSRCGQSWQPNTWSVHEDGKATCSDCAVKDQSLWIWQALCDVYDQIDELMIAADSEEQRKLLADLIAGEAPHFATWRDEPEEG